MPRPHVQTSICSACALRREVPNGYTAALKSPDDMAEAHEEVGAACGHFALAASLVLNVADVLKYFPGLSEGKSWCSVKTMEQAMTLAGIPVRSVRAGWPGWGVVLVQGLGPWMKPGVPYGARLARTHWIGVIEIYGGQMIADANHDTSWLPRAEWEEMILAPMLVRWRAVGWEVKRGYEVPYNDQGERP